MPDLTKEAEIALHVAETVLGDIQNADQAERETMVAIALVQAIKGLCYEVAAHRDATFMRLTDIESTLYRMKQ